MRLQRALARAGVASRRAAETLISAGRVLVNGEPATLGQSVTPGRDKITVDGQPVGAPAAATTYLLHKPSGTLTSKGDPRGRPTVFELVPPDPGLTYVGRLDYLTEGVLLMTTDGDMAHTLTHPSSEIERMYAAYVRGDAQAAVRALRNGVELDDGLVVAKEALATPEGRPLAPRDHADRREEPRSAARVRSVGARRTAPRTRTVWPDRARQASPRRMPAAH